MKIAQAAQPKIKRENRKTLPPNVVKEAVTDLEGSIDFKPHAYTDGQDYETYSAAQSMANLTIREASEAMGKPAEDFRRRVWHRTKEKANRKAKGPWCFMVSQRDPNRPRKGSAEASAAAS